MSVLSLHKKVSGTFFWVRSRIGIRIICLSAHQKKMMSITFFLRQNIVVPSSDFYFQFSFLFFSAQKKVPETFLCKLRTDTSEFPPVNNKLLLPAARLVSQHDHRLRHHLCMSSGNLEFANSEANIS